MSCVFKKLLLVFIFIPLLVRAWILSEPEQVIPGDNLPSEVVCQKANNNLDLVFYQNRLFLAFRTAPFHFASPKTRLYIISSPDWGKTWEFEAEVFLGTDMREPRFLALNNKLFFYFFEAGKNPLAFTPKHIYAMERIKQGKWTEPVKVFKPGCVLWRAKPRGGIAYATIYCGGAGEYTGKNAQIEIYFLTTEDGYHFQPVDPAHPVVARGGSETAFEFDQQGNLYAVIRNEAGDGKTWGGKICRADKSRLAHWECKPTPYKYDSPLMFRHQDQIYLIARRNLDGEFDKGKRWLADPIETLYYLARYWWTKKRTALYQLDTKKLEIKWLFDLPGKGDTAFPALVPLNEKQYLIYNYTSPFSGKDFCWMKGQLKPTIIYSIILSEN